MTRDNATLAVHSHALIVAQDASNATTASDPAYLLCGSQRDAGIIREVDFDKFIDIDLLPRLARVQRLAMAATRVAVDGFTGTLDGDRTGVFVGTGIGNLTDTLKFLKTATGPSARLASPLAFVGSVHNAVASQLAITHQLLGPSHTFTHGRDSFAQTIQAACLSLCIGQIDHALIVAADAIDSDYTAIAARDEHAPLGEGAAAFVVSQRSASNDTSTPQLTSVPLSVADSAAQQNALTVTCPQSQPPESRAAEASVATWPTALGDCCIVDALAVAVALSLVAGQFQADAFSFPAVPARTEHIVVARPSLAKAGAWWIAT